MAIVGYGRVTADGAVGEVLRQYERDVAPWWPPERAHVDNAYGGLAWPRQEIALAMPAWLVEQWTCAEAFGYATTWSATARHRAEHGEARLERLHEELAKVWSDEPRREIRWPLVVRACRR
jgi:hypothetical protein